MGLSLKLSSLCTIIILSMALFSDLKPADSASPDYTNLIYKGCARQQFSDPSGLYSQALSAMYGSLVTQSTKTKFYKTTTGTTSQTTITGLFQCRGDLSNNDCYNCVSRLPVLSGKLCGKTIAARVQLSGCYLLYEIAGFAQISGKPPISGLISMFGYTKPVQVQCLYFGNAEPNFESITKPDFKNRIKHQLYSGSTVKIWGFKVVSSFLIKTNRVWISRLNYYDKWVFNFRLFIYGFIPV